ncbi:MAG: transposase [Opitutaceae bacterium]|nr:transposase [Opitutaceae bacterium]
MFSESRLGSLRYVDEPPKYIHGFHQRAFGGRRMLPHLKRLGGTYFVTYRLADSLPRDALARLEKEISQMKFPDGTPQDTQALQIQRERFRRIEAWLDAGAGSCCLRRPEIAKLVVESLRFFDGSRYTLHTWAVMPNHVHVLVTPAEAFSLGHIVRTWKQFTARRAKPLLAEAGVAWKAKSFWQCESFDRWTRDADERERAVWYIHANPVKAGLCGKPEDWPWSSAHVAQAAKPACES